MRRVIWWRTVTVFWLSGGIFFSQLLNVYGSNYVWRTEIQTAEPLVPEPS